MLKSLDMLVCILFWFYAAWLVTAYSSLAYLARSCKWFSVVNSSLYITVLCIYGSLIMVVLSRT